MDGEGGVIYGATTINATGGVIVGAMIQHLPDYLELPITLPVPIAPAQRLAVQAVYIVPPVIGLDPFTSTTISIGSTGTDATLGVLLSGRIPLVVQTVVVDAVFLLVLV